MCRIVEEDASGIDRGAGGLERHIRGVVLTRCRSCVRLKLEIARGARLHGGAKKQCILRSFIYDSRTIFKFSNVASG